MTSTTTTNTTTKTNARRRRRHTTRHVTHTHTHTHSIERLHHSFPRLRRQTRPRNLTRRARDHHRTPSRAFASKRLAHATRRVSSRSHSPPARVVSRDDRDVDDVDASTQRRETTERFHEWFPGDVHRDVREREQSDATRARVEDAFERARCLLGARGEERVDRADARAREGGRAGCPFAFRRRRRGGGGVEGEGFRGARVEGARARAKRLDAGFRDVVERVDASRGGAEGGDDGVEVEFGAVAVGVDAMKRVDGDEAGAFARARGDVGRTGGVRRRRRARG